MYVLDTNAFYYAAGISECTYDVEKLQKLVDENEVFISSTSLFEFLIKFRNDIQTIHKGGKYLWEKKIKLAGNVINPLPNNFTGDIINLTESELQTLCSNILENKIDAESRFISILFDMCLFSGFYFSAMSDGVEPSGFTGFAVINHTIEFFSLFGVGAGYTVISINSGKFPIRIFLNVLCVVLDLSFITCSLLIVVCTDAAVRCDSEFWLFFFLLSGVASNLSPCRNYGARRIDIS